MQITSSTNSIYSTNSTSQTVSTQNTNNSFDTYLNTPTQETSTKTPTTSRILNFLEKHNKLNSLSPTDEKIFRNILADDQLTKDEIKGLSFEQVEEIRDLIYPEYNSEEWNTMPFLVPVIGVDLLATRPTGNKKFNEAFFTSLLELNEKDADKLRSEVDNNLGQLYLGKKLEATFSYGDSYLANPWEYRNMNADFGKFIKDVISHHQSKIDNPIVNPVAKEQYQSIIDVYKVLEKNYEKVVNKPKYAYI